MKILRALPLIVLASCNWTPPPVDRMCSADDQCPSTQLCFAEGCGDPGKGIVVEVEGGSLNGQFARDFALEPGTLGKTSNFNVGGPLAVSGEFQRDLSASSNPADRTSYTDAVVVRAAGQSLLLPGITRIYEERFASPERGAFEMKVGEGAFVVTAMPADRTVPPVTNSVQVSKMDSATTFVFPAVDGAPAITGQLIKKVDSSLLPPEPVLVATAFVARGQTVPTIDLQLFDTSTNQPLSQRFPISSMTGEFAITVSPAARTRSNLILVASPREPGVAVPTKRFVLDPQVRTAVSLEYGDFGEAADVQGTILDSAGVPIAGAQVVLEGTVVGDGTFRSKIVETDATGGFKVSSLGSKSDGSFQLTVMPPKGSRAAYSQRNVTVRVTATPNAPATATLSPSTLTLDDRLIAKGFVTRPGSSETPASGVFVRATLQVESTGTDEKALPVEPAETITGEDGTFELPLDPGVWRFEYTPGELLPISSRLVTVKTVIDDTGKKLPTQTLVPVQLSFGRTVSGNVTGTGTTNVEQPVPFSRLRFFRVTTVEGRPSSILLGTSIADERGRYQVVLPTVPMDDANASSPLNP